MEGGDYWKVLSSTNPLTTVPQKQPNLCLVSKSFGKASLLGSMVFKVDPFSIIDINFTVRFNYLEINCWF